MLLDFESRDEGVRCGVGWDDADMSVVRHVEIANPIFNGLRLTVADFNGAAHSNRVAHLSVWSPLNFSSAISLGTLVYYNSFYDIFAANAPAVLEGDHGNLSINNRFSQITAASDTAFDIPIGAVNYTFDTVTAISPDSDGFDLDGRNAFVIGVTSLNAGSSGIETTDGVQGATLTGILAVATDFRGVRVRGDDTELSTIRDIATLGAEGEDALSLRGGLVVTGDIVTAGCSGDVFSADCTLVAGRGDAAFTTDFDGWGDEIVADVASDATNGNGGSPSGVDRGNITDWNQFDSPFRGWGSSQGDSSPWPESASLGQCGGTCDIWSVELFDDASTLRDAFAADAEATGVHTWATSDVDSQGDCDSEIWGATYNVGTDRCESTYLLHAIELANDLIGNDNSLCESGEACVEMRNYGSYQGSGDLVPAGLLNGTDVTDVTLYQYEQNGLPRPD